MPTEPFEDLLYRDAARVRAKEIIDVASPLLQELVNYGTNAFMRCQAEATEGEEDEHLPVLILYLHMLEMTDGIEVLVRESCATPAEPLLRSSFEALLGISYILQDDYQRRAFSWMTGYIHGRIASYQLADPETAAGKEFTEARSREAPKRFQAIAGEEVENLPQEARAAAKRLERVLAKRQYQAVEAEYQAVRRRRRRSPQWYSLFGGPPNLKELARRVNQSWGYQVLYKKWSLIAHAADASRFLTTTAGGAPGFYPLRNPKELALVAFFAAAFSLEATRLVLGKFRPGETLKRWYMREVQDGFWGVQRMQPKIVDV